jgi:hypothetical protein
MFIKMGYTKIRQIDEKVNITSKCMDQFGDEIIKKGFGGKLNSDGVIWASLDLTDENFFEGRMEITCDSRKDFFGTVGKFAAMLSK